MTNEQRQGRRIEFLPSPALKAKIQRYADGNMSQFVLDAVKAKIEAIEQGKKNAEILATLQK